MPTLGYTGTRRGMSDHQLGSISSRLRDLYKKGFYVVRQGCCVGGDAQFTKLAKEVGYYVIGHPPLRQTQMSLLAVNLCDELLPAKEYLARDLDIVMECDWVLGTPAQTVQIKCGSGTWTTIGYAVTYKRPGEIIWPNGDTDPLDKFMLGELIRQVR